MRAGYKPLHDHNLAERDLSAGKRLQAKNYYIHNLKEIKRKKEEFVKRQREIEESNKESNWKMKKFLKVESAIKRNNSKHRVIEEEQQRLKNINKSDFIKKNILQAKIKRPKETPHKVE
jgi:alpha-D-ribose 1-methylphosphonate 5-triphosphate synthase subunit PhnI